MVSKHPIGDIFFKEPSSETKESNKQELRATPKAKPAGRTETERQNLPAIFFGVFVLLGFAVIWFFSRSGDFEVTYFEEVIVIGLIILYLVISLRAPGARVRYDQLGDNCYYLGFLYTLITLSVSLGLFVQNDGVLAVAGILSNFGIAILSTLVGIALRVILNQFRFDPEEIEKASRIQLSEATKRVKTELDGSIREIQKFRRTTIQVMQEGFDETKKDIDKIAKGILENVDRSATRSQNSIDEITKKSLKSSEELTKKLKEFSSSIDNLAAKNTTLAEAMAKVSTSFETLKAGYVDVDGNLSEVFNQNFSDLKDSISNLEKSVRTNKKLKTAKATVGKTSGVNRILRRILGWNKR